ncbi:hypothetical protein BV22DRAFT_1024303, partial [Leucogyrophana mollusca]
NYTDEGALARRMAVRPRHTAVANRLIGSGILITDRLPNIFKPHLLTYRHWDCTEVAGELVTPHNSRRCAWW